MTPTCDLNNIPYAQWLEKALQELVKLPVRGICIVATTDGSDVYTDYYNVSMGDKLVVSGLIQQDAMFDAMAANGMVEYLDENEEAADGEEENR